MTTNEILYLDGEFTIEEREPNTLTELKNLIGEPACVDNIVDNLRYRNKYPRVYKKVSNALVTEFPKTVKKEEILKDKTIRKVFVSDMDHIREFLQTGDEARKRLQDLFELHGTAEPLYVKGERGLGGKVSKANADTANIFFAQGDDVVEEKVTLIEAMVPSYKVGRDTENAVTPESLARGIQALNNHLKKQANAAAKAALGQ